MPQLAIAPGFLDDFSRLDRSLQVATLALMRDVMSGDRSAADAPLVGRGGDLRLVTIGPEWAGVLLLTKGDTYCLLTVRRHEEALAYARDWRPEHRPALAVEAVPRPHSGEPEAPGVQAPAELRRALNAPFDEWRRSTHPEHRDLIEAEYSGSAMVTGPRATGAGLVGLHRAAHLARREATGREPGRVVLATANLLRAQILARQLDALLRDPVSREAVQVVCLDDLARSVVAEHTRTRPQVLAPDELFEQWSQAAQADGLPFTGRFLADEWEQVILARGLTTMESYIRCDRNGRLTHLAPEFRPAVWRAAGRYASALHARNLWTPAQLAGEAARRLDRRGPVYRHIVVDDVHTLHPAHLKMVRAAVPEGPDDLFLVGDRGRLLYDPRVSAASLGIHIRGRSRVLRSAYRTTEEIHRFAQAILGTAAEEAATSVLRGAEPVLVRAETRAEEQAAVAARVRTWLEGGVPPAAVGVGGRDRWMVRRLAKELHAGGIATAPVDDFDDEGAVRLDTLERLGGQEFSCVALVGLGEAALPPRDARAAAAGEATALAQVHRSERIRLATAAAAARDALHLSCVGRPSRLLPEAVEARSATRAA